ncbi:RagB/SusD family nutrient uptake outer membrane protein [Cytophagaceae bacterium DM2B3-1]|uniref:RagB/SusD family nutrient uptake outer membrane protein n=1 Tax=Xanthocytophaga flava TaxID=3048013 RepID=A0ABT7CQ74_9BACT|nr:RagB/SusD family nutrient uptake outer membrane protein [Xanthocytophaga flavus]MDJ1468009.1 RagB/SusD family nutrient uptake outer membrane protein [Xanthocytophaga flavus]MDJ1495903.1 RagB/SusD family nutrient uptake outer membrane protein [Xanthocytophaga flavus]
MNKNKFASLVVLIAVFFGTIACKNQLDVGNPNEPTVDQNVITESGLISLAQGGVYINGFYNGDGWLGDSYFSLPWGYNELMADNLGADASNNQVSTIGVPDYIVYDDGTKVTNSSPSIGIIRTYNTRASTGASNNPIYYQWLNMYALNNACNVVLTKIDGITFTGDAATKANTFKAWCYWWKGYAYASIGSMYYSGLIIEDVSGANSIPNGNYVLHDVIIDKSNEYFKLAATTLDGITTTSDYQEVLGQLIPEFCQVGNGGVPSPEMWKRNINTMLARNILINKLAPFVDGNPNATITKSSTSAMSTSDWNDVLTYATNGIKEGDYVFTGRSPANNYFFSPSGGTAAALTTGINTSATFRISERFTQNFKEGDKRFSNNFDQTTTYKNSYSFTTRHSMIDGGNGQAGVYVYGSQTEGEYEVFIAGSYEENALMLAEANIRLGNTDQGLSYVDDVRNYMGAGIAPVSGKGLSLAGALTELVKERRVALIFRGLSFYDNRRWGWTYDIANGGGSYGNTVVTTGGTVYTNATINYNFLDYWDVPADESELNPSTSEVATKNPNF